MAYYTTYQLNVLGQTSPILVAKKIFDHLGYDPFDDTCTWYKFHDDMKLISTLFPEDVLQLDGEGEETGDQWVAYFLNGKSVVHRREDWVPPKFKEEDLS